MQLNLFYLQLPKNKIRYIILYYINLIEYCVRIYTRKNKARIQKLDIFGLMYFQNRPKLLPEVCKSNPGGEKE